MPVPPGYSKRTQGVPHGTHRVLRVGYQSRTPSRRLEHAVTASPMAPTDELRTAGSGRGPPTVLQGTHGVLAGYSQGYSGGTRRYPGRSATATDTMLTHRVLTGYSQGTHRVLTGYSRGTHRVLTGHSQGTHRALTGYSQSTHRVLTGALARGTHRVLRAYNPHQAYSAMSTNVSTPRYSGYSPGCAPV